MRIMSGCSYRINKKNVYSNRNRTIRTFILLIDMPIIIKLMYPTSKAISKPKNMKHPASGATVWGIKM